MRGKKTVLALVAMAAMLLVTAVALAHEGRLPGTKDSDRADDVGRQRPRVRARR